MRSWIGTTLALGRMMAMEKHPSSWMATRRNARAPGRWKCTGGGRVYRPLAHDLLGGTRLVEDAYGYEAATARDGVGPYTAPSAPELLERRLYADVEHRMRLPSSGKPHSSYGEGTTLTPWDVNGNGGAETRVDEHVPAAPTADPGIEPHLSLLRRERIKTGQTSLLIPFELSLRTS